MQSMTEREIHRLLESQWYGVLSLARENDAYAVPLAYGWDGEHLYFHTRRGTKARYMNQTREACFNVLRVEREDEWASALARGSLRTAETQGEKEAAMEALMEKPLPPEWGFDRRGAPARGERGMVFYVFTPDEITGRKSEQPLAWEEPGVAAGR